MATYQLLTNYFSCLKKLHAFTHFWPMFPFYNPWKQKKINDILVFSGGVKWEHWPEMGKGIIRFMQYGLHQYYRLTSLWQWTGTSQFLGYLFVWISDLWVSLLGSSRFLGAILSPLRIYGYTFEKAFYHKLIFPVLPMPYPAPVTSNVNEVIRAVLNFFNFFFFHKRFHTHKKHKNAYKRTKTKKAAFLCV